MMQLAAISPSVKTEEHGRIGVMPGVEGGTLTASY
jgi:hypothetical protein